jgi:signal transduction histidine kinase
VALCFLPQALTLLVRDDGCGFEAAPREVTGANGGPGHFGLLGMRERAESLGGKLVLRSAPGHGTEVQVQIPMV